MVLFFPIALRLSSTWEYAYYHCRFELNTCLHLKGNWTGLCFLIIARIRPAHIVCFPILLGCVLFNITGKVFAESIQKTAIIESGGGRFFLFCTKSWSVSICILPMAYTMLCCSKTLVVAMRANGYLLRWYRDRIGQERCGHVILFLSFLATLSLPRKTL